MRSIDLMFNPKQKQEYIDYEGINQQALTNYFKRIAKSEKEINKDVADMNAEELKSTIESLYIKREESRGHLISLLRGYINWAKLNGKTNNDSAINIITPESIDSRQAIMSQMLKSPEQVEEILKKAVDEDGIYSNQENRAIRDKLVFWLLYSGMNIEELQILKKTDLDYENKIIITENGNKYKVDNNIISLWNKCVRNTSIEKINGKGNNNEIIYYELLDNNYLFRALMGNKGDMSKQCSRTSFTSIILKIFKSYNESSKENILVSPLNIKISGIFYKLFMLEKAGQNITSYIIADYLKINYTDRNNLLLKTRKWRIDYEDWKLAFGYM